MLPYIWRFPLVAENHGGWGEVAMAVVARMARSLAPQTSQREEETMRQTWSRLASPRLASAARIPYQPLPTEDGLQ